jgi:hypothetical protein
MKDTWDYYKSVWNPNLTARSVGSNLRLSTAGFALQPAQQPPAQTAQNRQLRLLASVNRTTGAVTVLTATDVTGAVIPRLRRVGPYVFEANEGNNVIALEVVSGDPFGTHGYRGGGAQHTRVPDEAPRQVDTANIVVTIPGVSRDEIARGARAIGVVFYRLTPQVKAPVIERNGWGKLKADKQAEQVARITPDQLREFFSPTRKDDPRQGPTAKPPAARDDRAPARKQ